VIQLTTLEGRWYVYDGVRLPSVTTILRAKFPGPVAEDEQQQAEWDAKRDRGTEVHRLIAQGGVTREQWAALPGDIQNALCAAERFRRDYCYRQEQAELSLGSLTLGYAGTLDSEGRIPKGRVLVDWKTGRLHEEYVRYQLAAYFGLYVARYPRRKVYGALGVKLDCDHGTYAVVAMSRVELERYKVKFLRLLEEENE